MKTPNPDTVSFCIDLEKEKVGYYFNNSYVFKNKMDAEKYIKQLDSEDTFDIVELNFID